MQTRRSISPEAINRAGNEAFPRKKWAARRARTSDSSHVEKGLSARYGISGVETLIVLPSLYARVKDFLFFPCRMNDSALESRGGDILRLDDTAAVFVLKRSPLFLFAPCDRSRIAEACHKSVPLTGESLPLFVARALSSETLA